MSATTSTTRCSRQIDSVIENSVERPSSLFLEGIGETGETELTGETGVTGVTGKFTINCESKKG